MTPTLTIVVRGTERELTFEDMASIPNLINLATVSLRQGKAVSVREVLEDVPENASTLRLQASADGYSNSLPLAEASKAGLIWFAGNDGPLTTEQGGPFRFIIPNAADCKTAVLDKCGNVKHVDRIEIE